MQRKEKNSDVENLTNILSSIQNLYYKKREQLEELQTEITELKEILNYLTKFITTKSFHSAKEVYLELNNEQEIHQEERYFNTDITQDKVKGTKIKRKIFSKGSEKEGELLCVLNLIDMNELEIKLINPLRHNIREISEKFIKIFLKGALIKIKEKNNELVLKYEYFRNTDIIEKINIENLKSIKDYDLITLKIKELLIEEKA
ncbi:MAG: hypothetical protein KGD63_07400 [Candidatus Lokiarchaeota archaeon]|nr:hypothetical protein [Candidatus Lokiarchaeota archaeon]